MPELKQLLLLGGKINFAGYFLEGHGSLLR
jgi:hypothetical protein